MRIFTKQFWMERDVELYIGRLLRYGVMLSCGITLLGGIVYMFQSHDDDITRRYAASDIPNQAFGVEHYLRELSTIVPRLLAFDGAAIIQLGVIVLIATPIIRVVFSAIAFIIEKDYMYVAITLVVLCIIMANMLLGLH
ncbi:putative membrane protein [Dysgonomonas sp. PH5-45]|uniref:DUF1634 domain-containing protein n=1 Tax=unclassified Dysgonomonas TaxID=2630389 RepID=UPI002475CB39|nr:MULTISPECIES: DUF1634 domain-containing protein [unclassified Dysgonomonas]MDH6353995.1 putative membrane protein [Dysgonomonas sp. PH5-45]